jgi:hypothetical protein
VATTYELQYRLPRTEVVLSGTHSSVTDRIVSQWSGESVTQLDISVQTVADLEYSPVLELRQKFLSGYFGAVTQHADGRLRSARRSHSGQGGAAVKSLATLAGAVARGLALAEPSAGRSVQQETGDDLTVSRQYTVEHKTAADRRIDMAKLQRKAHEELLRLARRILEQPAAGSEARARMAQIQSALAALDAERRLADLHFEAWRAGTRSSVENRFELRIPVAELPTREELVTLTAPGSTEARGVPSSWQDLWQRFEIGLLATWAEERPAQPPSVIKGQSSTIQARRPDLLTLQVVRGRGELTVLGISRHFVVDKFSRLEKFDISKNVFRDTNLDVTFDDQGMLIGVSSSSTSALAGALGAASAVPDAFASGAESAGSVRDSVLEDRRASADAELGRLRQEIRMRRERIVAVEVGAMPEDAAELRHLQRAHSILEAQHKISHADPAVIGELVGHLESSWDWRGSPPNTLEIRIDGSTAAAHVQDASASGGQSTEDGADDHTDGPGARNPAL